MYYYTYNTHILAAAGIVGILVIAVVLTALRRHRTPSHPWRGSSRR